MKHIVVEVTSNNCRIHTVEDTTSYLNRPGFYVDPDLSFVKGHPPHTWKVVDGLFFLMNQEELAFRATHHQEYGVHNGTLMETQASVYTEQFKKMNSDFNELKDQLARNHAFGKSERHGLHREVMDHITLGRKQLERHDRLCDRLISELEIETTIQNKTLNKIFYALLMGCLLLIYLTIRSFH